MVFVASAIGSKSKRDFKGCECASRSDFWSEGSFERASREACERRHPRRGDVLLKRRMSSDSDGKTLEGK
jgi:hypothetical protein